MPRRETGVEYKMKKRCNILFSVLLLSACVLAFPPVCAAGEDWDDDEEEEEEEETAGEKDEAEKDFNVSQWLASIIEWGGYYENQLMFAKLPRSTQEGESDWKVTDYNKFRLDLAAKPVKGFRLDVDVVFKTYHGYKSYYLPDLLPAEFDDKLALWEAADPASVKWDLDNEFYLDNAFITISYKMLRLRVGKQQVRFGSGYFWNPTDLFNVKDLLDPTYEKRGITAIKAQMFFPQEAQLDFYYFLENGFEESLEKSGFYEGGQFGLIDEPSLAVRLRKSFFRWDVASTFIMKKDARIDLKRLAPELEPIIPELVISDRLMGGFEFSGEIKGVGLRGELAVNRIGDSERFIEVLGSIDYTFRHGIYVLAEYLYNSRGKNGSENYTFGSWINFLTQSIRYQGQHYVSALIMVPVSRVHLELQLSGIVNASDGSFVLNPWLNYKWGDYVTLSIYGVFSWGDDGTDEFPASGQGVFARLKFAYY